jgi:mercuric ion transport protein
VSNPWTTSGSLMAGAAAAIGASACCAGPLLLVVLGIGGAWGSRLVALQSYQPFFVVASLAFFGYAFYRLYRKPEACAPGQACAIPAVRQRQRVIFWFIALMAVLLMALPVYAPLFY